MNLQAVVARLARVPWVNKNQLNPKLNALVDQELAQLIKAPTVTASTFSFGSRQFIRALPDAAQVFKINYLVVGFGFCNQLVADCMVLMRLKTSLLARQPLQKFSTSTPTASCAFTGFLLEFRSQITVMVANNSSFFSKRAFGGSFPPKRHAL